MTTEKTAENVLSYGNMNGYCMKKKTKCLTIFGYPIITMLLWHGKNKLSENQKRKKHSMTILNYMMADGSILPPNLRIFLPCTQ
jgi:hypothetical protein